MTSHNLYSNIDTLVFLGVASALISVVAFLPYIADTLKGRTQPQRASWLIWTILGSIAFGSQVYEGASSSLWFAGVQVSSSLLIFLLSILMGAGNYLKKNDYRLLTLALAGIVMWYFTSNAAYALAITISISLLGGVATMIKAYRDPDSETLACWVISLIAAVLAAFSVGRIDWTLLAYPLYLLALYSSFIIAIISGRRKLQHQATLAGRRRTSPTTFSVAMPNTTHIEST